MDFLQSIRIYTLPRRLRIVLVALAIALLALNIYVIAQGFLQEKHDFWIQSGVSLLTVLLPLLILGMVLIFAHSGHQALKDRTGRFLTHYLPQEFLRISEDSALTFRQYERPGPWRLLAGRGVAQPETSQVTVGVSFEKNDCVADYRISVPGNLREGPRVTLRLRVEINVRKVNLVIWFDGSRQELIEKFVEQITDDAFELREAGRSNVRVPFQNTIIGALKSGYKINRRLITRSHNGTSLCGIVLIQHLSDEFLWSASEQLFFVQDLTFMLRALVVESAGSVGVQLPALFEESA